MPVRSPDTTADVEAVQVGLLRAASVGRRLRLACGLTDVVRRAARRAIGQAHPEFSARDVDVRFVELHYGTDIAAGLRADLARRDVVRTDVG